MRESLEAIAFEQGLLCLVLLVGENECPSYLILDFLFFGLRFRSFHIMIAVH